MARRGHTNKGRVIPGKQVTANERRMPRRWSWARPGPSAVFHKLTEDGKPLTKRAERRAKSRG